MKNAMSWIKSLLTVAGSFLFALVLAELILRIAGIGYGNAPHVRSPVYHHAHPQNYKFLMHDPNEEYGGYVVHYDENGYRVADGGVGDVFADSDPGSIVFLGDSFTEGNQVDYPETFVSLVGARLGVQTLNLGVSSYSPLMYSLQAKRELPDVAASTVVMQVYFNDFSHDMSHMQNAVFEGDELVGIDGGPDNLLVRVLRMSYFVRLLRRSQLMLQAMAEAQNRPQDPDATKFEQTFAIEQDVTEAQIDNTVRIIAETEVELAGQGKRLLVFLVPSKSLAKMNRCCDADRIYASFQQKLGAEGIAFFDAAAVFAAAARPQDLFFDIDIHFTAEGHRLLAEALSAALADFAGNR